MPRLAPIALICVLALPALPAYAAEKLDIFAPVIGKCFVADVGGGGRDRHCFEPVFGGKHVRDSHQIILDGKIAYRGETIYSRDGETIVFTYWNSLGGVGHGQAAGASNGIAFTGAMRAEPSSREQAMDSRWTWSASGGYDVGVSGSKSVHYTRLTK